MSLPSSGDPLVLLHNPRCSKSRATLALLEEKGAPLVVRRYLEEPLDREELAELGRRLGRPAREWIRKGEAAFADSGLSAQADDAPLMDLMAREPIVMERPILVGDSAAVVGRPPESVLELL
ncbi:MAG: arsenate reductase (glutaredoxin) [Myxococcota bacterium]